jgi:hypothetical protein
MGMLEAIDSREGMLAPSSLPFSPDLASSLLTGTSWSRIMEPFAARGRLFDVA